MPETELLRGFIGGFFSCATLALIFIFAVWCLPSKETLKHKYEIFPKRIKPSSPPKSK